MFKNKGVYRSLSRILWGAVRFEDLNAHVSNKLFSVFEKKINQLTPKLMNEEAKELLLLDISLL